MRILQIEDFFHPDAGYQANVISKYFKKFGNEVFVVTAEYSKTPEYLRKFFGEDDVRRRDEAYEQSTGVHIIRLPIYKWVSGRAIYKRRQLLSTISDLSPDVVFSHGASTFCTMRLILRHSRVPFLVTDNHMVDLASVNPLSSVFKSYYRHRIAPIVNANAIPVFCLGAGDRYVVDELGIAESCTIQSALGSDTRFFCPDADERSKMRKMYGLREDELVFIYAGKLDDSKGGLFLAQCIEERFALERDIAFVVVGDACGENADRIERIFRGSKNRVIRESTQTYSSLPRFFRMADVFLLPKQCSLTIFDAQACGLPVVAEDNDVNKDRLSFNNGLLFRAGNADDFRRAISDAAQMSELQRLTMGDNGRKHVCEALSYEDISRKMLNDIEAAMNTEP